MNTKIIAAGSGFTWAVLVAFIIKDDGVAGGISGVRWIACLAGPIVGLCIYYSSRWTFRKNLAVRMFWSAVSLYIAAVLYALILGAIAFLVPIHGSSKPASEIGLEAFAFAWAITFVPVLWPLFPLAFLNHHFLRTFEKPA